MDTMVLGAMYLIYGAIGRPEEHGNGATSRPSDSKTSRSNIATVYMFFSTRSISKFCPITTTFLRRSAEGSELLLATHLLSN